METVFFFKNMSTAEEEKLRDYFSKKIKKIEKMLSHFPEDGVMLHIKGEKFQKHSAYDVELVLNIPKQTLTAREASHLITKAVDLAEDRLIMQLKKTVIGSRRMHRSVRARTKVTLRTLSKALQTE